MIQVQMSHPQSGHITEEENSLENLQKPGLMTADFENYGITNST
jgi:hypothetical protein